MAAKVFGIGFHKTGTSSLAAALRILGYDVIKRPPGYDADLATRAVPAALAAVAQHDAFVDNPWPILFRELDTAFPGSRFILTERAPDAWIRSMVNQFGSRPSAMRRWIYGEGAPEGNEALYVGRYIAHNEAVNAHFAGRDNDLLRLPIADGPGWTDICRFLGREVPRGPFPHVNGRLTQPEQPGLARRIMGRFFG